MKLQRKKIVFALIVFTQFITITGKADAMESITPRNDTIPKFGALLRSAIKELDKNEKETAFESLTIIVEHSSAPLQLKKSSLLRLAQIALDSKQYDAAKAYYLKIKILTIEALQTNAIKEDQKSSILKDDSTYQAAKRGLNYTKRYRAKQRQNP